MALSWHEVLVVEQVTATKKDVLAVTDLSGVLVGSVLVEDGPWSRAFRGNRHFTVFDETGPVLHVDTRFVRTRERIDVADGAGHPLAQVVFVRGAMVWRRRIDLIDGSVLTMNGRWRDLGFSISGPGGHVATVDYRRPGPWRIRPGGGAYVLSLNAGVPVLLRLASIAAVLAADVGHQRRRNASASQRLITGGMTNGLGRP